MPKKITATDNDQDELIDKIKTLIFGDKNYCVLYELDKRDDLQKSILDLIPELRNKFLIHNIPGVQRPETLKRPWLSIMRNFLKRKYTIVSENYLHKTDDSVFATKRYIILPKDALNLTAG